MITLDSASPGTSTPLQKLSVPKRTLRGVVLNCSSNFPRGAPPPWTRRFNFFREKNKRASVRFLDKMRDPMLERFLIACVARVRHFSHDEDFHLRAKIERTPEQHRFDFICPDALTKIGE